MLFGNVNPAGRTTQTWVKDILDLPPMMDYDIRHGHTYMYNRHEPLYPFGYGLSYTDFSYSNISSRIDDDNLVVDFMIANTGDRDGEEVAQLYFSVDGGQTYKLKAFRRLPVDSGKREKVKFIMPLSEIGDWNETTRDYRVLPGTLLNIRVGSSSANTPLSTTITTTDN